MKAARLYKDNFRENPLFTLFFADASPIVFFGMLLAILELVVLVFAFRLPLPQFLLILGISEIGLVILTSGKKDNEMKYKAFHRRLGFAFSKKQFTAKGLDNTISNFTIVGNYIQRRKKLVAVYEIVPTDITFLNTEALEQFYRHIKLSYHNLTTTMMLVAKKEVTKAKDYNSHFYSLYTTSDRKREPLVRHYQEELSAFINENSFKKVKYYVVFSTHLLSQSDKHFALATKQLFEAGNKFTSSLLPAHIATQQLSQDELQEYCKSHVQSL